MDIVIHTDQMTLRCKEIHKLTLFHRTEKKVVGKTGMWFWEEETVEEESCWDLTLVYTDMDGKKQEYGATSKNQLHLANQFKQIQTQIKQQDKTFVDRAFEEQVLK